MDKIVLPLKAISDPTRIRIIMALTNSELCLCMITSLLELAPSTISKHMSILKYAGFIEARKDGRWIYFKIKESPKNNLHTSLIKLIFSSISDDDIIKNDKIKLQKILQENKEELCNKIKLAN